MENTSDPYSSATSDEEVKAITRSKIEKFPNPLPYSESVSALQNWVSTYLVHHAFPETAEAFAASTGQTISEDIESIRRRSKIKHFVESGKMKEAMRLTSLYYPDVFENQPNLLLMLKCRQFIEMVCELNSGGHFKDISSPHRASKIPKNNNTIEMNGSSGQHLKSPKSGDTNGFNEDDLMNGLPASGSDYESDNDTYFKQCDNRRQRRAKKGPKNSHFSIESMLSFGKNLNDYCRELTYKRIATEENQKLLKDAFSLLAYPNPWESSLSGLLSAEAKEKAADKLNAAILESMNKPKIPPIDKLIAHSGIVLEELFRRNRTQAQPVTTNDVLFK